MALIDHTADALAAEPQRRDQRRTGTGEGALSRRRPGERVQEGLRQRAVFPVRQLFDNSFFFDEVSTVTFSRSMASWRTLASRSVAHRPRRHRATAALCHT